MSNSSPADGDRTASPSGNGASAEPTAERRTSNRVLMLAVAAALVLIAVAVLTYVFAAERMPDLTEARLQAAMDQWAENGPSSYTMALELRGAQPGTVHIEVRDGTVVDATRDGREPPPRTWNVWSVPGQFDTLERELVLAEDPQHEMDVAAGATLHLRCEFDPQYGFPRRYLRFGTGGVPEVFWRVTAFEPKE